MNSTQSVRFRSPQLQLVVNFTQWCFCAILLGATLEFLGCTATYFAGSSDAPGNYRVYGHVRGAYGRSFLDQTAKAIRIEIVATIGGSEKSLLVRKYHVNGSDVGWEATWDDYNNLTVVFFDYGPGVDRWDARKKGIPKRQIRTAAFRFDSKTGSFAEQPAK